MKAKRRRRRERVLKTPAVQSEKCKVQTSANDLLDHVAEHVGEAVVAPLVLVGEALVIDAQQVQDGGVEVVDVDAVTVTVDTFSPAAPHAANATINTTTRHRRMMATLAAPVAPHHPNR